MNILVVGGGKMGMSHVATVSSYIGKSNVSVCDTSLLIRRLYRHLGYKTFRSVQAAEASPEPIDGVIIATPTRSHAAIIRWAIDRGIPLFVEKPLTLDADCSMELMQLAAAKGVTARLGFVFRYVASFERLRELASKNRLGRLHSYSASMRGNVITKPLPKNSWLGDFSLGGGSLNEYGPHIIDLCRFIFGPIKSIGNVVIGRKYSSRADDRVAFECFHNSGAPGEIEIDWCDPTKRKSVVEIKARFENAIIRVDNSTLEVLWSNEEHLTIDTQNILFKPINPPAVGFYLRGEEFSLEIEEFLRACNKSEWEHGEPDDEVISPQFIDGYEVDRLISEIASKARLA